MLFVFVTAALFALSAAAPVQGAPAPAVAPAARLTIDSTIETVAADPKGKAILDARLPGMLAHESYAMFKGLSLKQLQPYANGRITDAQVAAVAADLAKLK